MAKVLTSQSTRGNTAPDAELPEVREATPEELMEMLDADAQRMLGISGKEFLRRWFGGYYAEDPDQPGVMECAMLAPHVDDYWRKHEIAG